MWWSSFEKRNKKTSLYDRLPSLLKSSDSYTSSSQVKSHIFI